MKRFSIATPILFAPPNPLKMPLATQSQAGSVPSFSSFFQSYFGNKTYYLGNPNCGKMLEQMKRCFETNQMGDPHKRCSFYVDGFKRMACAK